MKRIPPEIDQLMWLVAEANDAKALEDFERQFPEHVAELGKRLAMVRNLKGAKVPTGVSASLPVFRPSAQVSSTGPRWNWVVLVPALAALAAASFFATSALVGPRPTARVAPAGVPQADLSPLEPVPPATHGNQPPSVQSPAPRGVETMAPAPPPAPNLRPQTVVLKRARLEDALRTIALACGLEIEIAPGLAELEVSLDYRQVSAIDMLKDMGPRFGFTAFSQGRNRVLIVPALDPTVAQASPIPAEDPIEPGNRVDDALPEVDTPSPPR